MIASALLALGSFTALMGGSYLIGLGLAQLAITIVRALDKRTSNPVPSFDHPAWTGNGA